MPLLQEPNRKLGVAESMEVWVASNVSGYHYVNGQMVFHAGCVPLVCVEIGSGVCFHCC